MNHAIFCWLVFANAVAAARGNGPARGRAGGRIVEGTVVGPGNKPIEGAKVLFGEPPQSAALVEAVVATTDRRGSYRAELGMFPWSSGPIQAFVFLPDFGAADRKIPAGTGTTTANFVLAPERWKETQIRIQDSSGRPAADEQITCSVDWIIWSRFKTDAFGRCRVMLPPHLRTLLSVEPKDARPVNAYLAGTEDEPASITLPVLPAIRGRVVDHHRSPLPNTAVGRWLTFDTDGSGEMLGFFGGALAATDGAGEFKIAPNLYLRFDKSHPSPKLEALCFAEPSFRSMVNS